MTKRNITISVDEEAYVEIKSKGLSFSKICNDALVVASGMPLENDLNRALKSQAEAVENYKKMIERQANQVLELAKRQKASLDDFLNPDIVSNSVILPENFQMLRTWINATGKIEDELRALKQEVINKGQRNRVSFPTIKRDELIKDLKAQGLKSDVE